MSDSLVSIRQRGNATQAIVTCSNSPLKPNMRWFVSRPPSDSQTEVAVKVMVHVKQVQPDIARSKHEEHSHEKYAKKGFFGYREKKINIPHT